MKKLRKSILNSMEIHYFLPVAKIFRVLGEGAVQILCDKKPFSQTASYLCMKVVIMKTVFRYFLSFFLPFALVSCSSAKYENSYSEKLEQLDLALEKSEDYVDAKEERISTIENMLHSRGVTELQQYHIYGHLVAACHMCHFRPYVYEGKEICRGNPFQESSVG